MLGKIWRSDARQTKVPQQYYGLSIVVAKSQSRVPFYLAACIISREDKSG